MTGQLDSAASGAGKPPLLSICISTYNRAPWLARTLPHVLQQAQPYGDLVEVLVVDNTSPDDTPALTARFSAWPNLRVHRNPKNVGMLGNLAVCAREARGDYVWVIGDDDLVLEGALERVLAALALHPDVELVYLNYAFTRFDQPRELSRVDEVVQGAVPFSTFRQDTHSPRLATIAARSPNCFTAIYCLVFRADHARGAYGQDTSGPPFSSLATCVPTTLYVVEHMMDRPAYWVGDPCLVVNMNVSWMRYASLFILERFPEIFDRMEARGVPRAEVDALRAHHVPDLLTWLPRILFGPQREHLGSFSTERLVRRFARVDAFAARWPEVRALYRGAHGQGLADDPALSPERLDAVFAAARGVR
jgi:hypothetical protein